MLLLVVVVVVTLHLSVTPFSFPHTCAHVASFPIHATLLNVCLPAAPPL
jgi:hypothetical protein